MATAAAILYSTYNGKKTAKTISDISTSATNLQIRTFTQALNALTNRSYVETYKVVRVNCDTEADFVSAGGNDEEDDNNG